MKRERFSIRRSMAVERARRVYEQLYGVRLSPRVFDSLSVAELEDLIDRLSAETSSVQHVAVLGYN